MELTLKRLLEQAKFTTTRKGYDQDEVDDFLDRAVVMATKVEARLTQALADAERAGDPVEPAPAGEGQAVAPGRSDDEIQAEIDAAVEERVKARLAEIEAQPPAPASAADEDAAAEEMKRTLVLAQRTADAAVAEAREEAESILTQARAEAASLTQESTADADRRRQEAVAEAEAARVEARARLADEIQRLDEARDALRSDVSILEDHLQGQRHQLQGAVAELQRLLDDPAAFRLAPAPEANAELPDLSDVSRGGASLDPSGESSGESSGDDPDQGGGSGGEGGSDDGSGGGGSGDDGSGDDGSNDDGGVLDLGFEDSGDADDDQSPAEELDLHIPVEDPTAPTVESSPDADLARTPVTAAESRTDDAPDDALGDALGDALDDGPPTAAVSAVELGLPAQPGGQDRGTGGGAGVESGVDGDDESDDAFLAELRKAMADEEPLGPREVEPNGTPQVFLDDDRRSWRFGKRR